MSTDLDRLLALGIETFREPVEKVLAHLSPYTAAYYESDDGRPFWLHDVDDWLECNFDNDTCPGLEVDLCLPHTTIEWGSNPSMYLAVMVEAGEHYCIFKFHYNGTIFSQTVEVGDKVGWDHKPNDDPVVVKRMRDHVLKYHLSKIWRWQ